MRVYYNIAHGKTVLWRFKQGAQAYYVKFYIVNNAIYATLRLKVNDFFMTSKISIHNTR